MGEEGWLILEDISVFALSSGPYYWLCLLLIDFQKYIKYFCALLLIDFQKSIKDLDKLKYDRTDFNEFSYL